MAALPRVLSLVLATVAVVVALQGSAAEDPQAFDRVFIIVLENQAYEDVMRNNLFRSLAERGTLLTNYHAITHPSQPNYLAMTSGNTWGVSDADVNLPASNIIDLLEHAGLSWKAYAEDYPTPGSSKCFVSSSSNNLYYRKHLPFISYDNVRNNPSRCAKIFDGKQLDLDIKNNQVPHYSFYVPNIDNDGHDTGLSYAATWITTFLGPRLHENNFIEGTLFIITFDEDNNRHNNHIYTLLIGPMVDPDSSHADHYNHYSLLRTLEANWNLGNLGRNDTSGNNFLGVLKAK